MSNDYKVADIELADFGRNPEKNGSFSWEKTDKADVFNK